MDVNVHIAGGYIVVLVPLDLVRCRKKTSTTTPHREDPSHFMKNYVMYNFMHERLAQQQKLGSKKNLAKLTVARQLHSQLQLHLHGGAVAQWPPGWRR